MLNRINLSVLLGSALFALNTFAQDLPEIFEGDQNDVRLYDLKYYYLESGQSISYCDSIAGNYSERLKIKEETHVFFVNEIARIALLTQGGQLKSALTRIDYYKYAPEIKRSNALSGYLETVYGNVLFGMSKPIEARAHYTIALEKLLETSDSVAIKGGLINLGNTYAVLNIPDSAMIYYEKAVEMENIGIDAFHFSLQNNLAHILSGNGDTEAGIVFYEKLVFQDKEGLAASEFTTASLNLGQSYNILGRHDEAVIVLKDAVKVAYESEIIRALPHLLNYLSFAYSKTDQHDLAYDALLEADSIKYVLNHQQIVELKNELEVKHQEELFLSEQNAKQRELDLAQKRKSELIALSSVLAFLLVVVGVLYSVKRKKNLLLVKQNLELAKLSLNKESKGEEKEKSDSANVSNDLKIKIKEALEEKKMFMDAQLSIEKFSKKINSNRTYVSEGVNEVYNESFRSVVNKLRIEEARNLLIDPEYENYSIEGVAITVGYRNISSFNSAFKRETGITPSYFRRNYLKSTLSVG